MRDAETQSIRATDRFDPAFRSTELGTPPSADPLAIHGLSADMNPYAYAAESPLANVDPSGLDCIGSAEVCGSLGYDIDLRTPTLPDGPVEIPTTYITASPPPIDWVAFTESFADRTAPPSVDEIAGEQGESASFNPAALFANTFQAIGGFLHGLAEGYMPGGVLLEGYRSPSALPAAETMHAMGMVVGGIAGMVQGLAGEAGAAIADATGIGALVGAPAMVVEAAQVTNGVAAIGLGSAALMREADRAEERRWKVGDDVYKSTSSGNDPSWSAVRARFWKNEAASEGASERWTDEQLSRMNRGLAPQRWSEQKGALESMELSHEPIPARDGGRQFVPRWPQDHAAVDAYRHPGY